MELEYWRILALVGTIIFLASAFMPLISVTAFGITVSATLIDFYSALGQAGTVSPWPGQLPTGVYGIFLTMILYPITVILGFVSLLNRKIALVAGILGITCWIGSIWAISEIQSLIAQLPGGGTAAGMIQYGTGIFLGVIGAIILLVAYFMKLREIRPETVTQ